MRLYVDADMRAVEGRRIQGAERRSVLAETLEFLRTQTQGPVEVIGEPGLGDQVRYSVAELSARTREQDYFVRNSAIHELQKLAGDEAASVWYRVLREDPAGLCVSSAFGLLLQYAGANRLQHRKLLLDLSHSAPGGEAREQAMALLDDILNEGDPDFVSRLRSS